MNSELLPCPFCGGQPEMRENSTHDFYIKCKGCGVATRKNHENSVGAVMDWNTRAERTCKEFGSVRVWQSCNVWSHELSCGHEVDTLESEPPNYCPNCGAKVQAND